jgi:hypothetical protein
LLPFLPLLFLPSLLLPSFRFSLAVMSLEEEEVVNPLANLVKLISAEGAEFIISKDAAMCSGTIRAMLAGPGQRWSETRSADNSGTTMRPAQPSPTHGGRVEGWNALQQCNVLKRKVHPLFFVFVFVYVVLAVRCRRFASRPSARLCSRQVSLVHAPLQQ